MNGKTDKFTAARIRRFTATGMAVQKALPFERPRFAGRPQLMMAVSAHSKATLKGVSQQQQAS